MATSSAHLEQEHRRLLELLQEHLLSVVGGEFAAAEAQLRAWQAQLNRHLDIEENRLLPELPADARWPARVYLLEHQRIRELAQEYGARVARIATDLPAAADAVHRRRAALALLDSAHALRHLLEHHHQREEKALAHELPELLLEQVWRD